MPSSAVEALLTKIGGVKPGNGGWLGRCPAHEDQVQSLKIDEGDDGRALIFCHAGCAPSSILSAMGLSMADLFTKTDPVEQLPIATYDYKDAFGALVYQVCRYPGKQFRQRRPDGVGGWVWNMTGVKRLPYRLNELKDKEVVVVVEGEKDADRLWSVGIPATTSTAGAKKWGAGESQALKAAGAARIIILPDNDEAGKNHADVVAQKSKAAGLGVNVVDLPGLGAHGDVSDWLNAGNTADDLKARLAAALYVVPAAGLAPIVVEGPVPLAKGVIDPGAYNLTDLGAAEAFRDRFGDVVRFDHQREQWLIWQGHHWRPDADEHAYRLAHEHVRKWQAEAAASTELTDYSRRKAITEFALGREQRGKIVAMMGQARALTPIASDGEAWDSNGWLMGCPNGVLDLKTGELRPGQFDDCITQQTGTPYDKDATCPRWERFVEEVFEENLEIVTYIHRALGYSLTADMREQCFFVAYGAGSNGKSIFLDTLETVWGTYGHRADMRIFAGNGADQNTFHNADFRGKRLVFAAEIKPNSRMNEHTLKNFTGGESLRAEHKYGRSFTIRPQGKIWLGVNHRPKVADDSFGFWRRVRLVPFLRTFQGSAEDRTLRQTLKAEAPGILAWAVRGCLEWQAHGLPIPPVVQEATEVYQQGEDPVAEFFEARTRCDAATVTSVVSLPALYNAYRKWAEAQGIREREMMTSKSFSNLMARRPFERVKVHNTVAYKGFELTKEDLFEG